MQVEIKVPVLPESVTEGTLGAVSLGTPHYSGDEIRRLVDLIGGRSLLRQSSVRLPPARR